MAKIHLCQIWIQYIRVPHFSLFDWFNVMWSYNGILSRLYKTL